MAAMCEEDDEHSSSSLEAPVLPWDRFKRWITCFCVVTFDIEVGQAMEVRGFRVNVKSCVAFGTRVER